MFGWVVFPSKEVRDVANQNVPNDPRIAEFVARLISDKIIFDASRMVYGGFKPLVHEGELSRIVRLGTLSMTATDCGSFLIPNYISPRSTSKSIFFTSSLWSNRGIQVILHSC